MPQYSELGREQLEALHKELLAEYDRAKDLGLDLDMSRGKPSAVQVGLSLPMMELVTADTGILAEDGTNCGNYGALDGIPEAKRLMASMLSILPKNVFVGGNSSLNLMHDVIGHAYVHGLPQSPRPWRLEPEVKFLCPSPGYDRHFAVTEHFGFTLVQVDMTAEGPDMAQVEELVKDPTVKGIWNIPKYSNPTGITYSDETVRRLAALSPAAPDFRIFWDNAYAVHDLDVDSPDVLLNLMEELRLTGKEDMVFMFTSTSKVTFPGAGISAIGTSDGNMEWLKKHFSLQTIGYDKLSQLRHARYLPDLTALRAHMKKHATMLRPKFDTVMKALHTLDGLGITSWEKPHGGYFIALDVPDGCAKRVVSLCKEAGVVMTPAGATHPYGNDPQDRTIRIAPTFPTPEELEKAADLLCLCVKLASVEKLLS